MYKHFSLSYQPLAYQVPVLQCFQNQVTTMDYRLRQQTHHYESVKLKHDLEVLKNLFKDVLCGLIHAVRVYILKDESHKKKKKKKKKKKLPAHCTVKVSKLVVSNTLQIDELKILRSFGWNEPS